MQNAGKGDYWIACLNLLLEPTLVAAVSYLVVFTKFILNCSWHLASS